MTDPFDSIVDGVDLEDPVEQLRRENRVLDEHGVDARRDPAIFFEMLRRDMNLSETIGAIAFGWGKTGMHFIAYSYETHPEKGDWINHPLAFGWDFDEEAA